MVVTVAAAAVAANDREAGAKAGAAPLAAQPPLKLVSGSDNIVLARRDGEVYLDLGTHMVAGKAPIEVRATRKSYSDPVKVVEYVNGKPKRQLPAGLTTDFGGLGKFLRITLTDDKNKKVYDQDAAFCLGAEGNRTHPDAPATSPYPPGCGANPFTLGAVWGLQSGWSAAAFDMYRETPGVKLAAGKYTAKVTVNKAYRDFFKIGAYDAEVRFNVEVKDVENCDPGQVRGCAAVARAQESKHAHHVHPDQGDPSAHAKTKVGDKLLNPMPKPHASAPTGKSAKAAAPAGPKPDLRALPAWQIVIEAGEEGSPNANRDFMTFSANVWNAGPSPLVLDGFRRKNQALMDAYQYFYDANGKQIGYQQTGSMEWDPREGHNHWHFLDFARYSLLNEKKTEVVRSQKESFCLANTDMIDFTLPGANWKPSNTDLSTSCGSQGSLSIREVLDAGSGDTYQQYLPGQSFDITDLPNGTYYIETAANPEKRLVESSTTNNIALRKVILSGTLHNRVVKVPPVGLVNAP